MDPRRGSKASRRISPTSLHMHPHLAPQKISGCNGGLDYWNGRGVGSSVKAGGQFGREVTTQGS